MPNWAMRVHIKHLLTEDDSPENAQRVGKEVARILRKSQWHRRDPRNVGMIAHEFEVVDDVDEFNEVMSYLYDLADEQRVWIA